MDEELQQLYMGLMKEVLVWLKAHPHYRNPYQENRHGG